MQYWFRSSLFNLLFYAITGIACIVLLPTLFMPRGAFLSVVHGWTWFVHQLEKFILGLDFEIRGVEHIPEKGAFIVAAKHQSAYETTKLHQLFADPAIILKKELLSIPLWGMYLKKSHPIAIDRSDRESATRSIREGALRVKEEQRSIVIFPQGTRVRIDQNAQEKPYRFGVARIQEATELPIVPLALNTGYFWPRNAWLKKPGKVIFEFLPPIEHGLEREALMNRIEKDVEEHSLSLLNEARENAPHKSSFASGFLVLLVLLALIYSAWWFYIAGQVKEEHSLFLTKSEQVQMFATQNQGELERNFKNAGISGFPGPITLNIEQEHFITPTVQILVNDIQAWSWPFSSMPIELETGTLSFQSFTLPAPIEMDSFRAKLTPKGDELLLDYAYLTKGEFEILASGTVLESETGSVENVDMTITVKNVSAYLDHLQSLNMFDQQTMLFVRAGISGFEEDGVITIPVYSQNGNLFAGPFMIMSLP